MNELFIFVPICILICILGFWLGMHCGYNFGHEDGYYSGQENLKSHYYNLITKQLSRNTTYVIKDKSSRQSFFYVVPIRYFEKIENYYDKNHN